jgi:DNA-binding HxlR family transcriptional regulator
VIDFDQLDRVIHEKGRLSIMSLLAIRASWGFPELKTELKMSDGNLITHLRTLEKAGYVFMKKQDNPEGRSPSNYGLTELGKQAYAKYLTILEQIVKNSSPKIIPSNPTSSGMTSPH